MRKVFFIVATVVSLSILPAAYSCDGWEWVGANLLGGCNSCNQDCGQGGTPAQQASGAMGQLGAVGSL